MSGAYRSRRGAFKIGTINDDTESSEEEEERDSRSFPVSCVFRLREMYTPRTSTRRWRAPPAVTALRRRRVDALDTRR